ncbi:hypothetical protein [uncultured Brevundimonas sp.]|uniref:hypothetical protein n=1 Tax=uncultured Brevundimonas sp. TaxID=213418 RepID=UPI002614EB39|nr:hypothetical protein [uncultured Brevundimonas sp.]
MTDTDKLKRLAEEVLSNSLPVCAEYTLAQGILALFVENERLARQYAEMAGQIDALMDSHPDPRKDLERVAIAVRERDDAVALLRKALKVSDAILLDAREGRCSLMSDTWQCMDSNRKNFAAFLDRIDAAQHNIS